MATRDILGSLDASGTGILPDGTVVQNWRTESGEVIDPATIQRENALTSPGWGGVVAPIKSVISGIGNILGFGSNSFSNYANAREAWNAANPNLSYDLLNADQRLRADNNFLANKMANQAASLTWLGPASFAVDLGGKILGAYQGFKQLGLAKDQLAKNWEVAKTNFNNNVDALRAAWQSRVNNEDWFGAGAVKSAYDPNKLKKVGGEE